MSSSRDDFIYESGWPPGPGTPSIVTFKIQSGAIREHGINGCQIDDVIDWAKKTLEELNLQLTTREYSMAITKLDEALLWLMMRRRNFENSKLSQRI